LIRQKGADLVVPEDLIEELNSIPFIDLMGQITLQTIDIQSPLIFTDIISEVTIGIQEHLKTLYD